MRGDHRRDVFLLLVDNPDDESQQLLQGCLQLCVALPPDCTWSQAFKMLLCDVA